MEAELNEFRLGNYYLNDKDLPEQIDYWTFDCYKYEKLKAIPLTKDWLIKFGFTEEPSGLTIKQFNLNDFWDITIEKDGTYKFWIVDGFDDSYHVKIKYVHKLQNLYYELHGEELVLK